MKETTLCIVHFLAFGIWFIILGKKYWSMWKSLKLKMIIANALVRKKGLSKMQDFKKFQKINKNFNKC
jgi:hypothetical protein